MAVNFWKFVSRDDEKLLLNYYFFSSFIFEKKKINHSIDDDIFVDNDKSFYCFVCFFLDTKKLEKKSDVRLKFQRSSHHINSVSAISKGFKYQNTYRLDPEKPLKIDPIDRIVKTVMLNRLEDAAYDVNECPKLCVQVATEIRKKILKLDFKRYKIVVAVTIIEKSSQSLETSMGFIWDVNRDNYSTYTFETQTFFAYCIVICTYCE